MSTATRSPQSSASPTTAFDLPKGTRAVVLDVAARAADAERLSAMGLSIGCMLRVVHAAPMLSVEVGASTLALGADWGRALHVLALEQ